MSGRLAVTLALAAAALVPATARGDGLPLPVDDAGPTGVTSRDGSARYVTLPSAHGSVVAKVRTAGGEILEARPFTDVLTIPVVALDGTPGGLSHDGKTLALIKPRSGFPRARTMLAFLNTGHMTTRTVVTLRGDFSFDALSPDGRTAYLVQYLDGTDPTKYRVRALQTATGHLAPQPIVDPHERGDAMNGYPLTRATSADGRWHYTLYDGSSGKPFVHALDTQAGKAKCIDLPPFPRDVDLYSQHLRVSGGTLVVGRSLMTVDTATFHVSVPAHRTQTAAHRDAGGGSSAPVAFLVGLALVLVLAGGGLTVQRRRRRAVPAA